MRRAAHGGGRGGTTVQTSLAILRYLRPHRQIVALLVMTLLVEVAFDSVYPLGVKYLVDAAVTQQDAALFTKMLLALGLVFLVAAAAGVAREYLSARLGARAMWDLRARLFRHLQSLSASFYTQHESGDLLSRFSSDLTVIENAFVRAWPLAVYSGLGLLVSATLLVILDWRLALVSFVALPFSVIGPRLLGPRATQTGYERRTAEGQMMSTAQETIGGHLVIRAFGLQRLSQERFEQRLSTLARASQRAGFLQRLVARTSYIGVTFGQLAVIGAGTFLVFQEQMTVGTLIGFIGLLITVSGMVGGVTSAVPEWLEAVGGMRRVEDLLVEQPKVRDLPRAVPLPRIQRGIRLEGVGFSYDGASFALRDVSLSIPAGGAVAFVGRSGSGKSTIFNLLTRFYEPTEGSVSIDGRDLRTVTQESLRAQMGVVFQETLLFGGTILDNIRLGKPDATRAEVETAARASQIHDLLASWPRGYDTQVGERGGRLSGGQRQRVALARAILRDPALLLLDEPTSALDPVTEAAFNETLAHIGRGRTVVTVTHRLSSVMRADRIFVMQDGRLAEKGTHAELLALGGSYAQMWRRQHEGLAISRDGRRAEIAPVRLRAMPLFADLDEPILQGIAERFSTERLPADRTVFEQGDSGDKFYVIAHGLVDVIRRDDDGVEQRLSTLRDGDVFGEMALLHDAPRTAAIRTRAPCLLLTLSRHQFTQLLEDAPTLRAHVQELAQDRVERTSRLLDTER